MATFKAPSGGRPELATRIQQIIRSADTDSARSRQRAIGPSEMGDPCDRRLTFKLLDMDEANTDKDPWPAIVGTACHAWLADAFHKENTRLGRERYLIERRVFMTDGISGTCDLFDTDEQNVIDHKVLGVTSMAAIKAGKVSRQYREQLHLYGYGYTRAGMPVRRVTLALYPRSGWLGDLLIWTEPYDEQIAVASLDRLSKQVTIAHLLDLETHPERWPLVPHAPGPNCVWCPFYRPGSPVSDSGCPGLPPPEKGP